jgi:hypothetical protein
VNRWTHAALCLILLGASTLQAISASASPIEIRFTGTVTSVGDGTVLPVPPEVGSHFEGSLWFDPAEVVLVEGNLVVSGAPADFDLGGVALASDFYQFTIANDYPGEDLRAFECAAICDIWDVTFATYDANFFYRFINTIEFFDQTAMALGGDDFAIPERVEDWTEARLRIIHPEPGGYRQDLEASIDSWTVVPESGSSALLAVALTALAVARTRSTPRAPSPSRSGPRGSSARRSRGSGCASR